MSKIEMSSVPMDRSMRQFRISVSLIVSAATGVLWAWCLRGFASPGRMWAVLLFGAVIGTLQGMCIRPFKDSDRGEKAVVITVGLFGTAFLFLPGVILVDAISSGFFVRHGLLAVPSAIAGLVVMALGVTSIAVPVLWPLAAINHGLIWWLQAGRVERA